MGGLRALQIRHKKLGKRLRRSIRSWWRLDTAGRRSIYVYVRLKKACQVGVREAQQEEEDLAMAIAMSLA